MFNALSVCRMWPLSISTLLRPGSRGLSVCIGGADRQLGITIEQQSIQFPFSTSAHQRDGGGDKTQAPLNWVVKLCSS